jgi:protein-tyrosine phosphatase
MQSTVLFVCMGNICRSPTAEGVFRHLVTEAGLADSILADSAGTHDYHVGRPPDARAQAACVQRGYDLAHLRARQVRPEDIVEFDYVLAMDADNLRELRRIGPPQVRMKPMLFTEFGRLCRGQNVPDPYYGGPDDFNRVLDMVEDAARGLLNEIKKKKLGV